MKKLVKVLAISLGVVMAFSLTSCGASDTSANNNVNTVDEKEKVEGEGEEEIQEAKMGSKGRLEFWTVFTGADGKNMQNMVNAYNDTNPEYTITHRPMAEGDLYQKLPLTIQTNQDVPDISIMHIERIPVFVENGFLQDVKPNLEKVEIKPDNYNEKAWKMTELEGGHFGIPLDVHSYLLYVNEDLYAKYGNNALEDGVLTYEEILKTGELAKVDGVTTYGMAWWRAYFLASYAQLGGTLSTDGETPDFNNEKAVKVFEQWKELADAGVTSLEGDKPWELFTGGKIVYQPEGMWMLNDVLDSGLNFKLYDYTVFDKNIKGNWTSSHQLVLPKKDRTEEETLAALKFLDYLGKNSIEWAKAGQVPAQKSIMENEEFKTMPQAFVANEVDELKIYDYKYYGYAVTALDKVIEEVFWGRLEPQEALDKAVKETQDQIDSSK